MSFSPLLKVHERDQLKALADYAVRNAAKNRPDALSELPDFLSGKKKFDVPVYVVVSTTEDFALYEKFATGLLRIPNLHIVDQRASHVISVQDDLHPERSINIRILGFNGRILANRAFDNGGSKSAGRVCGYNGFLWNTLPHIGELLELAESNFATREVRIFATSSIPSLNPFASLLANVLKVSIHPRICS